MTDEAGRLVLHPPNKSLVGFFSDDDDLDLEGNAKAIRWLAGIIEQTAGTASAGSVTVKLATDTVPAPYDLSLRSLCIVRALTGLVRISRVADTLEITGSPAALSGLADTLNFLAEQTLRVGAVLPDHIHVEHYAGHPWLDAASTPLVVGVV